MNYFFVVFLVAALGAEALDAFGAAPSWIANLGVVPLFLLAAFLLAPIALCLALRRFSVIAVLEAINISSRKIHYLSNLKLLNVTTRLLFVKVLLLLPYASQANPLSEDVILAKGEQKELIFPNLEKFSIGNPEVISYKFYPKQKRLLVKGKKIGYTDIVIWSKKEKKIYELYVLSKQKFLKTFQLSEALKNLNLSIDIKGPIMTAEGELSDFGDYLYLHKIKKQFQDQVFFKIKISPSLRNHIVAMTYKKLYSNGFSYVSCQSDWLDILCFYEGEKNEVLINQLSEHYKISFIRQDSKLRHKNFRVNLKLIQLEKMDGREIQIGLDRLESSVIDLFNFGLQKLIEKNQVLLSQSQIELSTLAEPEFIINLNTPQEIEIGSQIPYQNISTQGSSVVAPIDWRFAGLKIKSKLKESYGKLVFEYETEFTRPADQSISGSKEISSAIITPGRPIKIFQIGLQTISKDRKGIPILSEVPILKHLFESKSDQKTYKHIYGYIYLEELD